MTAFQQTTGDVQKSTMPFQVIVFRQGDEQYAIHIDQIREVVIMPSITPIPEKPAYIKGIANIRGNIVTVVDLEEKFRLKKSNVDTTRRQFALVIQSNEHRFALLSNELPNSISVRQGEYDPFESVDYIKGIIKRNNQLIIYIDVLKVLDQEMIENIKG